MKLRDWCELNTKRPDFFKKIPELLFDLVDKCLTVNPRLRISAEEALKHQFFAPCHEALRKQRLYRQTFSQGFISDSSSGDQNIFKQAKPPKLKAWTSLWNLSFLRSWTCMCCLSFFYYRKFVRLSLLSFCLFFLISFDVLYNL